MAQPVLYIIEPGKDLYNQLERVFQGKGFKVVGIDEPEDALPAISHGGPPVILLDVCFPGKRGFQFLASLHDAFPAVPVIAVSLNDEPVEIDKLLRLGAEDYIIKEEYVPEEVVAKVRRALAKYEISQYDTSPMKQSSQGGTPAIDITTISVLIIEDDQFLRDLSSRKLKQEGFIVDVAIDGNEGFKKVEEAKPDVILLDIILPGIDGFEILKRIRVHKNDRIRNSAVILLSNLGQESDVAKGERLGADDYLIKANFTIDEIIEKIKTVLANKRQR